MSYGGGGYGGAPQRQQQQSQGGYDERSYASRGGYDEQTYDSRGSYDSYDQGSYDSRDVDSYDSRYDARAQARQYPVQDRAYAGIDANQGQMAEYNGNGGHDEWDDDRGGNGLAEFNNYAQHQSTGGAFVLGQSSEQTSVGQYHDASDYQEAVDPSQMCVADGCQAAARSDGLCLQHIILQEQQAGSERVEEILDELVASEKQYVGMLKTMIRQFVMRLRALIQMDRTVLTESDMSKVFQNLEMILDTNRRLYADLKKLRIDGRLVSGAVAQTMSLYTPFFKMYTLYVNGYEQAVKMLTMFRQKRKAFDEFCQVGEKVAKVSLETMLIAPVQRLPRYLLLLETLESDTPKNDPSFAYVAAALEQVRKVTESINGQFRIQEDRNKVLIIQMSLDVQVDLVHPSRHFVLEGALKKKFNSNWKLSQFKVYYFYLFNDVLLYSEPPNKQTGKSKFKHILRLLDMDVRDAPGSPSAFQLLADPKSMILIAANPEEKAIWMVNLRQYIRQTQERAATLKKG